ncbi:hypothetical protein ACQZ57_17115 [Agrobacterium vitis]
MDANKNCLLGVPGGPAGGGSRWQRLAPVPALMISRTVPETALRCAGNGIAIIAQLIGMKPHESGILHPITW